MRIPMWVHVGLVMTLPVVGAAEQGGGDWDSWRANAQQVCEGITAWSPKDGASAPFRCEVASNSAGMIYRLSPTGRGETFSTGLLTLSARELTRQDEAVGGHPATMAYRVTVELDDRTVSMQLAQVRECRERAQSDAELDVCLAARVLTEFHGEVQR